MNPTVRLLLDLAQGPLFRLSFALLVLGLLRLAALGAADMVAAYVTLPDRRVFWQKVRRQVLWQVFPSLVLRKSGRPIGSRLLAYHVAIGCASLVFRTTAVLLPAFMMGHVYLWERGLGVSWPALPGDVADRLAVVTLVSGSIVFLSRLYSPLLRSLEPAWAFFKPLIILLPLGTGFLTRHPSWSPLDYHVVLLIHLLSACAVFVLIPFGRLLTALHTPLVAAVPEAAWSVDEPIERPVRPARAVAAPAVVRE